MVLRWVLSLLPFISERKLIFSLGTAGYGSKSWAIGQSYADSPILTPVIYDPTALAGHRWSNSGFAASTVPRMYHSTALLLADGK